MKLLDVYPLFEVEPVKAKGSFIWDSNGNRYLDLYGGHAVISIGHSHPHYLNCLSEQLGKIGFYSNSVKIGLQEELAEKLGKLSGYADYNLFLCNSGAEANENAFKLASFQTGRKKIIAFSGSFHGRTSLAVAATDDKKIQAPVNEAAQITFLPLNDADAFCSTISEETAAVIIEGIQGVAGVKAPSPGFLRLIRKSCDEKGVMMILDEVQSGYGRTGKFFAHQYADVRPDIITVAKGMGNGFPVAGVLSAPHIKARHGMLGTTFGGSHLACAAAIAVLDVINSENLMQNALVQGEYLSGKLRNTDGVKEVRGTGLMIGVEMETPCAELRSELLSEHKIFTGSSSCRNTLRILPSLAIGRPLIDEFAEAFSLINSKPIVQ
ncbi:MAG: aspartate aminotransferase family protein [Bacteroidia bacterium]